MMKTFFHERLILLSTCDWSSTAKKETLVEHLDHDSHSNPEKGYLIKQSQQAANDQRAYNKVWKARRVKQNVETAFEY